MNQHANVPALIAGGQVTAIVPQTVEETWRLATMVVSAGIAPVSVTGKPPADNATSDEYDRWGKKASSAVATVILSGAELGLPPMVALRSFTVINGRPALFGDGLINVVRRHRKAEYVRTGCDERNGKLVGWCEAKRSDTGEVKREEFSEDDARRAGLWDDRQTRRGKVWKNGQQVWGDVPNDSTWFRYPKRMLAWRAAGYCLRELFADVLGGITDEFEAREIAGVHEAEPEMIAAPSPVTPPSPPSPPSPPRQPAAKRAAPESEADGASPIPDNGMEAAPEAEPGKPVEFPDPEKVLADAESQFAAVTDEASYEEVRTEFAHYAEVLFPPDWDRLVAIMQRAYDRVTVTDEQRDLLRNHPVNGG